MTKTAAIKDITVSHHATREGFGIAIIRIARSGDYAVVRTVDGTYVALAYFKTEREARTRANVEWKFDRSPPSVKW